MDVDGVPFSHSRAIVSSGDAYEVASRADGDQNAKEGALHAELGAGKELLDFLLTRSPGLYRFVERRRKWLNWDRRLYLSVIREGDVVLDVGANVGAHTILFSHLAGTSGRVVAFEPLPPNIDRLRKNVARRCRFTNVAIYQGAVGDATESGGEVTLLAPRGDLTQASRAAHETGSWSAGSAPTMYRCPITSIDAYLAEAKIRRVDFLKIDVEGAELSVLRGARATLSESQPLVYCEVFDEWTRAFDYAPADLFAYLGALGYTETRLIREGRATAYPLNVLSGMQVFDVSTNVLFSAPRHSEQVDRFDRAFGVTRARSIV